MILLKTAEPKAFHDLLGRGLKPTSLCRPGRAHQPISFTCRVMPAFSLTHSPILFRHRTKAKSCVLAPGQQAHATRLKPLLVGCQDPTLPNARWPPFVFCTLSVSFIQFCTNRSCTCPILSFLEKYHLTGIICNPNQRSRSGLCFVDRIIANQELQKVRLIMIVGSLSSCGWLKSYLREYTIPPNILIDSSSG